MLSKDDVIKTRPQKKHVNISSENTDKINLEKISKL